MNSISIKDLASKTEKLLLRLMEEICAGLHSLQIPLEVATKERAIALIENDPYFVPSYRTYQLLIWGKAFAEKFVVL